MSSYLPDGFASETKSDDGFLKKPVSSAGKLSPEERAMWLRFNASVSELTPEFKAWLTNFILVEVANQLPVSLRGFVTGAQIHKIGSEQSTGSAALVDLATVGPTLTDLGPGGYLVFWGASIRNTTAGSGGVMAMEANGVGIGEVRAGGSSEYVTATGFTALSLTANTNTLLAKYKITGSGTAGFYDRHLAILRYANS